LHRLGLCRRWRREGIAVGRGGLLALLLLLCDVLRTSLRPDFARKTRAQVNKTGLAKK
jgi:hypothetical protein